MIVPDGIPQTGQSSEPGQISELTILIFTLILLRISFSGFRKAFSRTMRGVGFLTQ